MKKSTLIVLTMLIAACFAAQAFAQDNTRQGIFLDLGLGFGNAEMEVEFDGASASVDFNGPAADFKLGGFVNPNLSIFYVGRAVAYTLEDESGQMEDLDAVNFLNGVGINYFVNPQAPSFYLSAGAGVGGLRLSDGDTSETETGGGFTVGIGYEFVRNWSVEASYLRAKVASEGGIDVYAQNMALTVNWLFY